MWGWFFWFMPSVFHNLALNLESHWCLPETGCEVPAFPIPGNVGGVFPGIRPDASQVEILRRKPWYFPASCVTCWCFPQLLPRCSPLGAHSPLWIRAYGLLPLKTDSSHRDRFWYFWGSPWLSPSMSVHSCRYFWTHFSYPQNTRKYPPLPRWHIQFHFRF